MLNITPANDQIPDNAMLTALAALVRDKSVTRAADRLGISQPAMSASLKRLREMFGDPILIRLGRNSTPTPRAMELATQAADILERLHRLREPSTDDSLHPETLETTIRVMATDYAQHVLVREIIASLREAAPGVRLDMRPADRTRAHEWMASGEVDMGIGPINVPTGRLHFLRLYRDRAVCVLGKQFFKSNERLTLDRYCKMAHLVIVPAMESYFDAAVLRAMDRMHCKRQVGLTVPGFLTVTELVQCAPLIATVPSRLLRAAEPSDKIIIKTPPLELPDMPIGLYWHERTHQSPVHRWFRGLIKDVFLRGA
jgi:DNA-binding transcriptional LysR family regulator